MITDPPLVHIVDDDDAVRTALARLLRSEGYRVECSASAQEFLARPSDDGAACVVLDLAMPGMGGLEVQQRLTADNDPRPVLFLTGEGDISSGVNAMKAGAIDFLTKPVDGTDLVRAVSEALRRAAEVRERRRTHAGLAELVATLTAREREVMALVVAGLPNKRIARELGIAEKTVKIHRGRVMQKMRTDSVADLVRAAVALREAGNPVPAIVPT